MLRNSVCRLTHLDHDSLNIPTSARLKEGWRSAVYQFFSSNVTVGYDNGCKYHFFKCVAQRCRNKGLHGVRRYQDSKDQGTTSNREVQWLDLCIFCVSRPGPGQSHTSHAHSIQNTGPPCPLVCGKFPPDEDSFRSTIPHFDESRPPLSHRLLPSGATSRQPLNTVVNTSTTFSRTMLATSASDAWTSPNHCAFVAWTIHLHHEGHLLCFLLDVIEVPEVSAHALPLHM